MRPSTTALTTLLLTLVGASNKTKTKHVDVVIVGAGLSGLSTARRLAEAGVTFTVLEARSRVGGRTVNARVNESPSGAQEMGAEYVGPTQDRVLELARWLAIETYKTFDQGNTTVWRNGTLTTFHGDEASGGLLPLTPEAQGEVLPLVEEMATMAANLTVGRAWEHPRAAEWDSMTCASFVRDRVSNPDARFVFDIIFDAVLSVETHEPSLLYWLSYISSAGNETQPGTLARLLQTGNGAQESRVVGGTQQLSIRLAERLGLHNILFNSPVHSIVRRRQARKRGSRSYHVHYGNGRVIMADHVVVAMSPPLAGRITYEPPMPAKRDQLTQRMPMSTIAKMVAVYPKPFWRDQGLNGQVLSDEGVTRATFDNSPDDGSYGALMGFIGGNQDRQMNLLDESEVRRLVTKDLVRYFGPQAAYSTGFYLQRWDLEPYSRGGPVAYAPPGVLTEYGSALRQPVGDIHFAGTESSDYWVGYMDGALRSGERVAKEILDRLKG
ncbi:amine oxidase [Ophiocordyceps camponoti-floridani]|uniref:Amine oxidase n=1 Tax=Ophiocordyceps camponoti-floridani TaxID=2030778 RepID=A0A8H4VCK8_9HYPO|nr:amine oxidase [Ophiocordyceps camponoti-floridani]